MKTVRRIQILGLAVFTVLLTSCDETYNAQVQLDKLLKLDSERFGHLNSIFVTTGDIINLDPQTKSGTRVGHIDADTIPTVVFDSFDVAAGNSLDVSFTGSVPSDDLQIGLKTAITNSTALSLKKPSAIEIGDIVTPLNRKIATDQIDPLYNSAVQNHEILIIVTKLIKADDLSFSLNGQTSVTGSVSQMKIGNYTLNVTYTDNASLSAAAKNSQNRNTGIFFKAAVISKTSDGKYVPQNTNDVDLSGYSLTDALEEKIK